MLGTRNLLKVLRDQLEQEGVGVATPGRPDAAGHHRADAGTSEVRYCHPHHQALSDAQHPQAVHLGPETFEAIYDQAELDEIVRINLRMEFATTKQRSIRMTFLSARSPSPRSFSSAITNKVMDRAKLPNVFSESVSDSSQPTSRKNVSARPWTWIASRFARIFTGWTSRKVSPSTWPARYRP